MKAKEAQSLSADCMENLPLVQDIWKKVKEAASMGRTRIEIPMPELSNEDFIDLDDYLELLGYETSTDEDESLYMIAWDQNS